MNKLTPKQKKYADNYLDNGGNGTQAVKDAKYNVKNDNTASSISTENLRKPDIIEYLKEQAEGASSRVVEMSKTAESETVKLAANKDILDRAGYKPVERHDITSKDEKITLGDKELLKLQEYEKKFESDLKNE